MGDLFSRPFDVLMWFIVGAILVTILVTGGGNSVKLATILTDGFTKSLKTITGQAV